jgi:transcription antitermination factor NusG
MSEPLKPGDRVKIIDGTFAGNQGTVVASPRHARYGLVVIETEIFGKLTPVDLEPWQVRRLDPGPG